MIDTHSHIYAEEFDADRQDTIARARAAGVKKIVLPNVDSESLPRVLSLEAAYSGFCYAAIGLHPTSVKENYKQELSLVRSGLERRKWIAVGEIGIDLYWDKTFYKEQIDSFRQQAEWALEYDLPIIIHVRDSFRETMDALSPYKNKGLRGVFHSFTGSVEDAAEILDFGGFKLGVNGIVTFKNSGLGAVIRQIGIEHILLETDSPYLTPVPFRGKRNESAYVDYVCAKLSEIYGLSKEEIDRITTQNAENVFAF
ncbi:MAG: TatD family hydrolase [Prevotellaceae bacterium]|jgi:TatD DNase family protein|nr:TatD family hydrolase [Prevotellaceae bacterium]